MEAVDPARLVSHALSRGLLHLPRHRSLTLVAAGKAAVPMASTAAVALADLIRSGVVAGPEGGGVWPPAQLDRFAPGHPDPNADSERAGRRAMDLARSVGSDGTLLVLLSGGASAMLAVPAPGITLDEKSATSRLVMNAGLGIDALNCVRKHLSSIKGGRLAAAAGHVVTLAISDVHAPVPDDPAVIGSGPTVADPTTYADALAVVRAAAAADGDSHPRGGQPPNMGTATDVGGCPHLGWLSPSVGRHLERGSRGELQETIKPGDARLARSEYHVIGNRLTATEAAADAARSLGFAVHVIDAPTSGEARDAGRSFCESALRLSAQGGGRFCVIGAGETTVTVRGDGRGGRNQEFALGAARVLDQARADAVLASAGTDGIDGPTDAAGAVVDTGTLDRARHGGLDPSAALLRNDTYPFFAKLGDLIMWGPTGTNVADLHIFLRA